MSKQKLTGFITILFDPEIRIRHILPDRSGSFSYQCTLTSNVKKCEMLKLYFWILIPNRTTDIYVYFLSWNSRYKTNHWQFFCIRKKILLIRILVSEACWAVRHKGHMPVWIWNWMFLTLMKKALMGAYAKVWVGRKFCPWWNYFCSPPKIEPASDEICFGWD
jgi:hypothetical protein